MHSPPITNTNTTDPSALLLASSITTTNNHPTKQPTNKKLTTNTKNNSKLLDSSTCASSKPLVLNRSHTFHSNNLNLNNNIDCSQNVLRNFLLDAATTETTSNLEKMKQLTSNQQHKQQNLIGGKLLANYVVKNGKRLFAWNRKHQQSANQQANKFETLSASRNAKSEEMLTNLIAAKLLSESIELAKIPYTDEACLFIWFF
jgi:hypothetical protein